MKLLISAYACIPHRGSEPGVGWNWTLEHARLGHQVWCMTTPDGKRGIEEELACRKDLKLRFVFISNPAWVNSLYRFQPFFYFHYLLWQYRAARAAIMLDRTENFDLLLHVTLSSFQLGSGLWRLKKPLVFGPVGGGNFAPRAFKKYFSTAWTMEILRKWTSSLLLRMNPDIRNIVKTSSLILVANHDTRAMAARMRSRAVKLFMDSGLSEDFFPHECHRDIDDGELKILWVGRIFARKGLPLVLEALSKVKPHVHFHLTILGDGKSAFRIPEWIRRYRLSAKVTWRGHVSLEELKKAYATHDVFMLCSLRDSFGGQFLEAMAYSLPIITLRHQGAGDHIPEDAGIKVPVTTPDETTAKLAEAVAYMYERPAERVEFGKRGLAFARSQRWALKINEISGYYERIVNRKCATPNPQSLRADSDVP